MPEELSQSLSERGARVVRPRVKLPMCLKAYIRFASVYVYLFKLQS